MSVCNGQFNLSNYQVQNNNTLTARLFESNKTPIQAINDSRAKIQAITQSFIQVHAKNQRKKVTTQEATGKSRLENIEVALLELANSKAKQLSKGRIQKEISSKRIDSVMGEGSNIIDKSKDKSKSIKSAGGEHDSSMKRRKGVNRRL